MPLQSRWPDVRSQRVHGLLVPVEGERVVPTARVAPECLVEARAQLLGVPLEPLGELPLAPDLARELGEPDLGVVDVALHLARRDRRLGVPPVMEELRVARVLPRLVEQPVRRAPLILDEAVPVQVAVLVDPLERAQRGLAQVAHEPRVVRPAPDLREQDEVERRRVHGAVVAREPRMRALAVPHLVDDLAGLGVDVRVVLGRLELGEDGERVLRQLGPEEERLETGDDRVPPEDGHEPRHPGCRQRAGQARVLVHAQRGQVGDRAAERVR